ncbi:MAG: biopolymer transporter ExbD [Gammaproteobacteria bacterium]|nr:MAG: biopolymer transporter ExbD [Gammaproteobacteria bacterium]
MAIERNRNQTEEAQIDMTPMLDVVFIMLIFFIVTTSFVREAGVSVVAPTATEVVPKPKASVFIAVTKDNEIFIAKKKYKPEEVRVKIARLRQDNPEGAVVIQADKRARAGIVMKVLDEVKAAGVTDVSIAAHNE